MAAAHVPARLEALGITKTFPGTKALRGVDFRVEPGCVRALIGENGAGKSTLVNILGGVFPPTSGTLLIDGRPVTLSSTREAAEHGIRVIHQELQLFPELSVADNLFVGRERITRLGTIDTRTERRITRETVARLGLPCNPDTAVGSLPLGQRQLVEIARALAHDARVLMMDEPTSALTASEIHSLFAVIRDLAATGVSVVYISHRLEELLDISDTVTVLRDGQIVGEAPSAAIDVAWIVDRMTGGTVRPPRVAPRARLRTPLLSLRHVTLPSKPGRSTLDDVSLDVEAGEIVCVYGLMGAGRTELFETVLGLHGDARGVLHLEDVDLAPLDLGERMDAGVCLIPEDRKTSGLIPTLSVLDNMTMSSLDRLSSAGYLSRPRMVSAATTWVDDLDIRMPALDAPVTSLSGGNQQKVLIARALMRRPKLLLMDEPTRGVDVGARADILETLQRLAATGLGIVFSSSDLQEVLAVSARTVVMSRGRVAADFGSGDATEARIASAASAPMDRPGPTDRPGPDGPAGKDGHVGA